MTFLEVWRRSIIEVLPCSPKEHGLHLVVKNQIKVIGNSDNC